MSITSQAPVEPVPHAAPAPLARTGAAQIASLTGLRGFAALVVVLVHASGRTDFPWVGLHGYGPVSLFVLSGFLLFRPWAKWILDISPAPDVRAFAKRRVWRIFPAYLVVAGFCAVIYPPSQPNGVEGTVRALTLTGIFARDGLRPGLEQTWSLGTEVSWYVALPVVGTLLGGVMHRFPLRHRWWLSIGLLLAPSLALTIWWRVWLADTGRAATFTYPFWLPGFIVCFFGGAALAQFVEARRRGLTPASRPSRRSWAAGLGLGIVILAAFVGQTERLGGPHGYVAATFAQRQVRFASVTMLALFLLAVCVGVVGSGWLARLFSSRPMTAVGRWSYGIFLWHLPMIEVLEAELPRSGGLGLVIWTLVIAGLSTLLGALTYGLVEVPAVTFSKRATRREAARHAAPGRGRRRLLSRGRRGSRVRTRARADAAAGAA